MNLQDLSIKQLQQIVDGAPEGAEFKFSEKYGKDWRANLGEPEVERKQWPWRCALWRVETKSWNESIVVGEDYSGLFLNLSDIRAELLARDTQPDFSVGDLTKTKDKQVDPSNCPHFELGFRDGDNRHDCLRCGSRVQISGSTRRIVGVPKTKTNGRNPELESCEFKVGDRVVPKSEATNLVRAVREVLEVDGDQIRYHMEAQVRSYWSKAKGWRHATPEEIEAGHRIDALERQVPVPLPNSIVAANSIGDELPHYWCDAAVDKNKICIEEETPELFESKHCSPRPMVDHELKAPASAAQQQIGGNHYTKLAIQPMHYSLANNLNAAQHTIIKYVTRYQDKGGIEDLLKARHTLDLLIEHLKGEQANA